MPQLIQVRDKSLEEREFAKVPKTSNMSSVPLEGPEGGVPTRMECGPVLLSLLGNLTKLVRRGRAGMVPQEREAVPEARFERSKPGTGDTQASEESRFVEEPAEMEGNLSVIQGFVRRNADMLLL